MNKKKLLFHFLAVYGVLTICSLLGLGVADYTWWRPLSPLIGVDSGRTIVLIVLHVGGIAACIATAINIFDD